MYNLQIAGDWMEVEVVTPSDYCVYPEIETRRHRAWIKYLDNNGRALIFFYTRGC